MSHVIVAFDEDYGIGLNNSLPWKGTPESKQDLQRFKEITMDGAVIMGYNTYHSIGKALPGRLNIVVTKKHYTELKATHVDLVVFDNLHAAVKYGQQFETKSHLSTDNPHYTEKKCFIIGGAQIYREYLTWYNPKTIYITHIKGNWNCDTVFPKYTMNYTETTETTDLGVCYRTLSSVNAEENSYLDSFRLLLNVGHVKEDRTNVGTVSYFSPPNLEFSLRNNTIPILTTKTVAMKTGVIPELLWFISGSTDTKELEAQNCNIWRDNTSREFLDKRGLTKNRVGELGPGYGFQWRHAGEQYRGLYDEKGERIIYKGTDQLADLIHMLKTDPDSRRMLMVSWAPAQVDEMALPPCHVLYQVYTYVVDGVRYLSAKMYQRSADSFLGVPFNIASYALLTHMLAHITGYTADRIVFTYGDYHIYKNHLKQVEQQLSRSPRPFPKVLFLRSAEEIGSIDNIKAEDFQIIGYNPHPKISAQMAV